MRDGTPAREVDIQWHHEEHWLTLGTKKDDCWINMGVDAPHKIGEDLKAILYSLRYEPGKDKPVTVPADVREFLDKFSSDMVSHDLAKVMTHYSDRFLNSGTTKRETEESTRQIIGSITSFEIGITEFVPAGDKVYLAGFRPSVPEKCRYKRSRSSRRTANGNGMATRGRRSPFYRHVEGGVFGRRKGPASCPEITPGGY